MIYRLTNLFPNFLYTLYTTLLIASMILSLNHSIGDSITILSALSILNLNRTLSVSLLYSITDDKICFTSLFKMSTQLEFVWACNQISYTIVTIRPTYWRQTLVSCHTIWAAIIKLISPSIMTQRKILNLNYCVDIRK